MPNQRWTIETPDGDFDAYVATPKGEGPWPAVLAIQEIFGINAVMREVCDRLADIGFLAVCPDLFWRIEPGIELTDKTPGEWKQALGYMNRFDFDQGMADIQFAIHQIRARPDCTGKVGAVGYCLGGRLAYMAATRTDITASVGYYGVMIDSMLNEAHAIANPLMLHIPTADHFVGANAQAAMHAELDSHPKVVLHDYQGLDHGFAAEMGNRRDEEGARLADGRTAAFFHTHLR